MFLNLSAEKLFYAFRSPDALREAVEALQKGTKKKQGK